MDNQNQYQGQYNNYVVQKNQSVVSVGDWIITFIIMMIPFVNIIMLFVWAFGSNTSESKANWAKAGLLFYLIMIILVICFYGSIIAIVLGVAALGNSF